MESVKDASHLYAAERRALHAEPPGFRNTELQISPDQNVPWHLPQDEVRLGPDDNYSVRRVRPHLVTNGADGSATFLVLQDIGEYDYVPL
jgi:hypothetical protein